MAGRAPPTKFYAGAKLLQSADALDAFVRLAPAGAEFVYCEADGPQHAEDVWIRARQLAGEKLVRTHQRRREGGGWAYYVVRTAARLPNKSNPIETALAEPATDIIFRALKRAANFAQPCPTDTDLARLAGLTMRQMAGNRVRKLIDLGLIESSQVYESGVPARVVTILAGRYAGSAAGKSTEWPKKYAALQRAAERELRAGSAQ